MFSLSCFVKKLVNNRLNSEGFLSIHYIKIASLKGMSLGFESAASFRQKSFPLVTVSGCVTLDEGIMGRSIVSL